MKRTLILILALLLTLQGAWALPATWSQRAVFKLNIQGVVEGALSDLNAMQQAITREEFAEMAVRLYIKASGTVLELLPQTHNFEDTDNPYVGAAYRLGIVNGMSSTVFAPKAKVTREQIATMLYRELTILGLSPEYGTQTPFSDDGQIASWAKTGVNYCKFHGLVNGVGNNRFAPKNDATREQVFMLVDNILTKYKWGLDRPQASTDFINAYKTPTTGATQLVLSERSDMGITLRIQSGFAPEDRSAIDIEQQWLDLYDILIQKWSYTGVERLLLQAKDKWESTNLQYSFGEVYYLTSTGTLQSTQPKSKPYIQVRYQGVMLLDIYN
ncbi:MULTISPECIES: S-layer homology domain-containing protein [unclassified Fusibacter]|uniref:S-layer homology domain-containing protein n=1 Tax=unclassified Fusibacter TaxID=2624464 RepID=UPI0010126F25|nr:MULTISPECIES: S-layer homology domain-containing protein [unclassified Fusibacter]MCK8059324.1 S-layer homology domain-containing protein [Fusibacter sp. A2]NPE21212.1 S-layer homology domain-containing protein [Fusibacter sp. A1]RXV62480.1 S-layer homology domain-containing protein [Fusibacter sp. A1]